MSTKSTILNTPWCHVYRDYAYNHGETVTDVSDLEVLVIEASYGNVEMYGEEHLNKDNDTIIIGADSEFAKMVIWMCEQYKAAHDKVEDVDINGQPEPLKSILNGLGGLGNKVKVVNGILTIKTEREGD